MPDAPRPVGGAVWAGSAEGITGPFRVPPQVPRCALRWPGPPRPQQGWDKARREQLTEGGSLLGPRLNCPNVTPALDPPAVAIPRQSRCVLRTGPAQGECGLLRQSCVPGNVSAPQTAAAPGETSRERLQGTQATCRSTPFPSVVALPRTNPNPPRGSEGCGGGGGICISPGFTGRNKGVTVSRWDFQCPPALWVSLCRGQPTRQLYTAQTCRPWPRPERSKRGTGTVQPEPQGVANVGPCTSPACD